MESGEKSRDKHLSSKEEDELCVERVLSGAHEDFRFLVTKYQDRVFRLILKSVGNESTARDLAQESFLRAYRGLQSFRREAQFSTWLTRIALNVTNTFFASADYKRQRNLHPLSIAEHIPQETLHSTEQEIRLLQEAIGLLKPKLRDVIVLSSLEGKSYEETAAILQIPVGTVRSRLNQARSELRKLLFVGSL